MKIYGLTLHLKTDGFHFIRLESDLRHNLAYNPTICGCIVLYLTNHLSTKSQKDTYVHPAPKWSRIFYKYLTYLLEPESNKHPNQNYTHNTYLSHNYSHRAQAFLSTISKTCQYPMICSI